MKYKFKLQQAFLVGGLLATTYAEACWVQSTSFLCVTSGSTVDSVTWLDNSATKNFTATADWWYSAGNDFVYSAASGSASYTGTSNATFCDGPAKFFDFSGHSVSIPDWQIGSCDRDGRGKPTIHPNSTTSGGSC